MAIVPPLYSRINLKELIRGVIYLRVLSSVQLTALQGFVNHLAQLG
jgi:hypothetical protein